MTHISNSNPPNAERQTHSLDTISARLATLAGTPWCDHCNIAVTAVLEQMALLLRAARQLCDELATARLEAANLRAAMRAALGAAEDGEPDPLAFLRWELAEHDSGRGRR